MEKEEWRKMFKTNDCCSGIVLVIVADCYGGIRR